MAVVQVEPQAPARLLATAAAAAVLRAKHTSLRLPDALVIASASQRSADQLLTTDRRWPTAMALRVKVAFTEL